MHRFRDMRGAAVDPVAHPLTDEQAKLQVLEPAREIAGTGKLKGVSASYLLMSCKNADEPPYQGAIYLNFDVPGVMDTPQYFASIAAAMTAKGWTEAMPPSRSPRRPDLHPQRGDGHLLPQLPTRPTGPRCRSTANAGTPPTIGRTPPGGSTSPPHCPAERRQGSPVPRNGDFGPRRGGPSTRVWYDELQIGCGHDLRDQQCVCRHQAQGLHEGMPGRLHLRGRPDHVHQSHRVRGMRSLPDPVRGRRHLFRGRPARGGEEVPRRQRRLLQRDPARPRRPDRKPGRGL